VPRMENLNGAGADAVRPSATAFQPPSAGVFSNCLSLFGQRPMTSNPESGKIGFLISAGISDRRGAFFLTPTFMIVTSHMSPRGWG